MSDAPGLVQFMTALGEVARGASVPSIRPVWKRELLLARDPPRVSCVHHNYLQLHDDDKRGSIDSMAELETHCFFFGPEDMACLKKQTPHPARKCSNFDVLTACLWRCHTVALNLNLDDEVRVAIAVDARTKFNPPLPVGYYGNATGQPVAITTVGELCQNPLGYAVELIMSAKASVTDEFMRSTADFLAEKGRPGFNTVRTLIVSDLTRLGFTDVDFGWGKALYGGTTRGNPPASFFVLSRNNRGEGGIGVVIDLPRPVMATFALEIQKMIGKPSNTDPSLIVSSL